MHKCVHMDFARCELGRMHDNDEGKAMLMDVTHALGHAYLCSHAHQYLVQPGVQPNRACQAGRHARRPVKHASSQACMPGVQSSRAF